MNEMIVVVTIMRIVIMLEKQINNTPEVEIIKLNNKDKDWADQMERLN